MIFISLSMPRLAIFFYLKATLFTAPENAPNPAGNRRAGVGATGEGLERDGRTSQKSSANELLLYLIINQQYHANL